MFIKEFKKLLNKPRIFGFATGVLIGLVVMIILLMPKSENLHARGPANLGHEKLSCTSCHKKSDGTLRQQIQAKVRYLLKQRESDVAFGLLPVDNDKCLNCHINPKETHPVYRFNEPRYEDVRKVLAPQNCISCHREHQGVRIVQENLNFCSACHKDTKLKKDPLDISHEKLIASRKWSTCLGCHDYHGNHEMTTPHTVKNVIKPERIKKYFSGKMASPYSKTKRFQAKKEDQE